MNTVYQLVNLNDASTTLSNIAAWATPLFAATIILAAVLAGIIIGGMVTARLLGATKGAIKTAVNLRSKGGGRRRRRR